MQQCREKWNRRGLDPLWTTAQRGEKKSFVSQQECRTALIFEGYSQIVSCSKAYKKIN